MNGINAPKVVECLGSDGKRYRQLAKSGNDDLRQDAVRIQHYPQFFFFKKFPSLHMLGESFSKVNLPWYHRIDASPKRI